MIVGERVGKIGGNDILNDGVQSLCGQDFKSTLCQLSADPVKRLLIRFDVDVGGFNGYASCQKLV